MKPLWEIMSDQRTDRLDYVFTMPGIALSGQNVLVELADGEWRLTQVEADGRGWTAHHSDKLSAVLALIQARAAGEPTSETPHDPKGCRWCQEWIDRKSGED